MTRYFSPKPIKSQIIIGLIFGILTKLTARIFGGVLFMDCIWTCAASFLGLWSGIISALMYHVILHFLHYFVSILFPAVFIQHTLANFVLELPFIICSLTVVFTVRHFCKKELTLLKLIFMSLFLTLAISIEGGLIFTLVFERTNYEIYNKFDTVLADVIFQNISIAITACLSRIPVNIVDKTIAVFAGYRIASLIEKWTKRVTSGDSTVIPSRNSYVIPSEVEESHP